MRKIMKKSLVFLVAFVGLYTCVIHNNASANNSLSMYYRVWDLVNKKYVDQTNNTQDWTRWKHKYDNYIKTDEDAYVAINTMVSSLNDPYTRFMNPKEFAEEANAISGSLRGIGVQIGIKDGKLTVIAPIEDTPAEKAGLQADDLILEINGESTKGMSVDKAADRIRGEEGTSVTLLIKRGNQEAKPYTIKRKKIEVKSISQKLTDDKINMPNDMKYIRLSSFMSKNAANEFKSILLENKDKKGFIIDLRSNPGGLLSNAISISNMFLEPGEAIVSTVDRDGYIETQRAKSLMVTKKPVVVLINKGSASASEIFSGALKDNGRAVIVGDQSYGKGLVQQIENFGTTGLHITIQKYLTPNGTDIHKKGITPDYLVKISEEDSKNKNDVQLKKAIEVLQTMINKQSVAKYSLIHK